LPNFFSFAATQALNRRAINWVDDVTIEVTENTSFSASIQCYDDIVLRISKGCAQALEHLQKSCSAKFKTETALEWLILHELHHADLGHFEILDGRPVLNLVTRGSASPRALKTIPRWDWPKVSPCLELQADHDALEMMLGDYSASDWASVRTQATSIAAIMVLIEKAGSGNGDKPSTHPHAATRIFQLLGHVAEMWSIPAFAKAKARCEETIRGEDLPPQVEVQAFTSEVVLPVFWDAVALAKAADAKSIIADLGSPEDFFADIGRAKLGQWADLVTVGAKEWATLKEANEVILPLLPISQATN